MISFVYILLSFLTYINQALSDVPPFLDSEDYQFSKYGPYPRQRFFSDPDVVAPVANVIVPPQEGVSPNKLVTWSPHGDRVPVHGPQLLDAETLSVVYQGPTFQEDNFGITHQTCNGSDYMVWWSGTNIDGRAAGHFHIFNSTYHNVWNVSSIGLKLADAHDIFITPDCHAIITVYEPKPYELEDWHLQDNSWLLDSYFQEIDLATNELVFQWRASDHIDMHGSRWIPQISGWDAGWQGVHKQNGWDFFHMNSVEKDWRGNYLISSRHMNAIYYLEGVTGAVKWQLGGEKNDFTDLNNGYATDFAWQHHVRWANDDLTMLSVFDDRNCRYIKSADPISRGALISLDFDDMTAELVGNYRAPAHIEAFRKGGMQVLENGNILLGFGNEPAFTEYAPNNTILWDVRMGPVRAGYDRETADNYRSYKLNWTGMPWWGPKIAAGPTVINATEMMDDAWGHWPKTWKHRANDTAYFSWNGATRLAKWMVLAADHPLELDSIASILTTVNRTGFETGVYIGLNSTSRRYVRAVAVSSEDEILAGTPILDMRNGTTYETAKDVLMGVDGKWWHGAQDPAFDKAVEQALEGDGLDGLRKELDELRHGAERKRGGMMWGAVFVIAVFAGMAWMAWKQLNGAFEEKYGVKSLEDGFVHKAVRKVKGWDGEYEDEDGERESQSSRLGLMYSWRQ